MFLFRPHSLYTTETGYVYANEYEFDCVLSTVSVSSLKLECCEEETGSESCEIMFISIHSFFINLYIHTISFQFSV